MAYICALVEYSHLCGPLREALEKLADLEKEKIVTEKLQKEQEEKVSRMKS